MGSQGAIVMGFFGAVFATMTLVTAKHVHGWPLSLPWLVYALILGMALVVLRRPGAGLTLSPSANRAMMWSTIFEGVAIPVGALLVVNLGRPQWVLPVIALIVGLHFLPIASAERFLPVFLLGLILILAALLGFALRAAVGIMVSGFTSAAALWIASALAVARDARARRTGLQPLL